MIETNDIFGEEVWEVTKGTIRVRRFTVTQTFEGDTLVNTNIYCGGMNPRYVAKVLYEASVKMMESASKEVAS